MTDPEQMTAVARERADKAIDTAVGALRKAAHEIGMEHNIPEGIAGHSIEELLGRMAYVPTMARDLRRACGQEIAKTELQKFFESGVAPAAAAAKPAQIIAGNIPGNIPTGVDIESLEGVSTQTVTALRNAGLNNIGDIVNVPDEHLIKMDGLGEKSVAHVRAAIAKAAEQQ